MAEHKSRYSFIITDAGLVALRLTRRQIAPGQSASRPQRSSGVNYRISDGSAAMTATTDSTFHDDEPLQWLYQDPEFAVVPWAASGSCLTVKLALWCLAMMATHGDNHLDYEYPPLDSWRKERGRYVHNTSGVTKKALSRDAVLYSPAL